MKSLLISAALVTALGTAHAGSDALVAGNTAASTGDHVAAAEAFERALTSNGWSTGTLLDLGNAYASAGQRGRAILAYERARLLAPRDVALGANLARVRELAGLSAPPRSRVDRVLGTLTSDEWTWIALAACILACAGISAYAWSIRRPLTRTLAITGVLAGAIAFAAAIHVAPDPDLAIIVTGDTARIAPYAGADAAFTAAEGARVLIEQRRGDFVYVRDGDRTGWLPSHSLEPIVTKRAGSHA